MGHPYFTDDVEVAIQLLDMMYCTMWVTSIAYTSYTYSTAVLVIQLTLPYTMSNMLVCALVSIEYASTRRLNL